MALRERQGDSRQEDGLHFPQPLRRGIRFENVGFHYPSNERWILRHLNFEVAAGETVALVGVNGTGKSTLIKLLNSLYEPVEGQILVDEVPLNRIAPTDRVANISVIFQDFILYNVSAAENIWFGAASEQPDPEKVRKAAREAGIDKVIEGFAQGYNTTLGTLFEGSEQMSPGQWQRLALARSFYNDAQLILLDEPTIAGCLFGGPAAALHSLHHPGAHCPHCQSPSFYHKNGRPTGGAGRRRGGRNRKLR